MEAPCSGSFDCHSIIFAFCSSVLPFCCFLSVYTSYILFSWRCVEIDFNNANSSDRILRINLVSEDESPSRVKIVPINSQLLASKSLFFCKMFSNGMRETKQRVVDLTVDPSDEVALSDLLQFMDKEKLKATTHEEVLKVLVLADQYMADECVTYCVKTLSSRSMTFELAMSCINLPSCVLESDNDSVLQSLVESATYFLSEHFILFREDALELPLESIENLLSWDSLKVGCEDDVFEFVIDWIRNHYNDRPQERRQVFGSRLLHLIRFPYMSCEKLMSVPQCEELEQVEATKMVAEALQFKCGNHLTQSSFPKRAYRRLLVEATTLDRPHKECIAYTELNKEECDTLAKNSPEGICTQDFQVGNESFYLEFKRDTYFGVTLHHRWSKSKTNNPSIYLEIATRLGSSGIFVTHVAKSCTVEKGQGWRYGLCTWDSFMAPEGNYFYNGAFYIRVSVALYSSPANT